jgi:hypothetical protein
MNQSAYANCWRGFLDCNCLLSSCLACWDPERYDDHVDDSCPTGVCHPIPEGWIA